MLSAHCCPAENTEAMQEELKQQPCMIERLYGEYK